MSTLTLKDLEDEMKILEHKQDLLRQECINFHGDMVSTQSELKEIVAKQTTALKEFTEKNAPLVELYQSSGFMGRFILRSLTVIGSIIVIIIGLLQLIRESIHK